MEIFTKYYNIEFIMVIIIIIIMAYQYKTG